MWLIARLTRIGVVVAVCLATYALAEPEASSAPAPVTQVWAGHQVVLGTKKIPVLGRVSTRTDTFLIARVVQREDGVAIEQEPCVVEFAEVAGVKTRVRKGAAGVLPGASVEFISLSGGWFQSLPWVTRWGSEDLDDDGKPGVTIDVDGLFCSGEMYVANSSRSVARGRFSKERFEGMLKVAVRQKVLGASSACLKLGVSDAEEMMRGQFRYVPVDAGARCEDYLGRPWPARAPEPQE